MKKRLLSLALVFVMVFTLLPFQAFAIGHTTISDQPRDVTAKYGEQAHFGISATNDDTSDSNLEYVWFDDDKAAPGDVRTAISSMSRFNEVIGDARLGEGKTLTITAEKDMNIACAVYWEKNVKFFGLVPGDLAVSNTVKLSVDKRTLCENGHTLTEIAAVEPNCAHEGNNLYYKCTVCGYFFIDETATTETTPSAQVIAKTKTHGELIHHDALDATCSHGSVKEHWECSVCGQLFTDAEGTKEAKLSDVEVGSVNANNHVNVEHHDAVAATCSKQGSIEYWYCKDCNTYFSSENMKKDDKISRLKLDADKDKNNHVNELIEHEYIAPTCTTDGQHKYYECPDCGAYFSSADATGEYAHRSDVKIDELGHNYKWVEVTEGDHSYHQKICTVCNTIDKTDEHRGGTATCQNKAICSDCGAEYGEIDENTHVNTKLVGKVAATIETEGYSGDVVCSDCGKTVEQGHKIDKLCVHTDPNSGVVIHHDAVAATCNEATDHHAGNIEYWECTECGKLFSDEALTKEVKDTVIPEYSHFITFEATGKQLANPIVMTMNHDDMNHWQECKYCGYQFIDTVKSHNIVEADATCSTGAHICATCGYDDGVRKADNHSGPIETVGAKEPVGTEAGYTGDKVCKGCNAVIENGRTYYAECPEGTHELKHVDAVAKTCYDDGVKEHYECSKCLKLYADADGKTPVTAEDIAIPCTGHDIHPNRESLASLSYDDITKVIDAEKYKEMLKQTVEEAIKNGNFNAKPENISSETILAKIHIRDIDHCHDDEYHWLGCQECGKTLADIQEELKEQGYTVDSAWIDKGAKTAHKGGDPTCLKKAVCDECGEEYGPYGQHHFNEFNVCTVCSLKLEGPKAPTGVGTSCDAASGHVKISWKAVEGAKAYQVFTSEGDKPIATVTELSFIDTSTVPGTNYKYVVRAVGEKTIKGANGTDETYAVYGEKSKVVSRVAHCAQPVLVQTSVTSGKPSFKWEAVEGATSYIVYRAPSLKGEYTKMYETEYTSYTNSSAKVGYTYYYKVVAISKRSSYANSADSAVMKLTCKLPAPTLTTSNNATTGKNVISWKAVDGATNYEVYRATSKNGEYKRVITTVYKSYTDTKATAGYTYYYKVKAIKKVDGKIQTSLTSEFSSKASRTCDCAKPEVSITLKNGKPSLSWKAVTGADSVKYIIYRATSANGTYYKYDTVSSTSYTNTGAKSGTTYYYKVVAYSTHSTDYSASAYSNVVSVKSK